MSDPDIIRIPVRADIGPALQRALISGKRIIRVGRSGADSFEIVKIHNADDTLERMI